MLYHLTPSEAVASIRDEGLRPADNSDATDPLRVAEETRDRLLDKHGSGRFDDYSSRRHSVFFYTDPVFAADEAEESGAAVIVVDENDLNAPLFSADRNAVEDFFATIRSGMYEGGVTDPAYDADEVEAEAERIATEDFRRWDGTSDATREVWGVGRVRPELIDDVWE